MTREKLNQLCNQIILFALMAMLLVVPLIFFTFTHDVFEFNKITALRLFTLIAAMAFMTKVMLVGSFRFRPSPLWGPVILIAISSLLSTIWTNNKATSIFGVYEDFEGILTIANYLLLWFLVHHYVRTLQDIKKFLVMIVLAGVLAGGYGIAQNFGIDFIMWNPNTYSASRLFGSLGNPNFLAAYVLMALPIALMLFLNSERRQTKRFLLLAVVLMALAIFFTKSRGAFYALVAEMVFFSVYVLYDARRGGYLWSRNLRWIILLVLLGALTLFSPYVRGTIKHTVVRTWATLDIKHVKITPRLYIWRSALQMMRDKPVLGSGLDTFQITFPKYRLAEYWRLEWNGTPEKAHNFFLQIGATTGLLGLGAWLWLLVVFFAILWKQQKHLPPTRRYLSIGVGIAQIGFLVQNQFNFTVVAYGSLFWFLIALGPTLPREETEIMDPKISREPFSLENIRLNKWMLYLAACGLLLTGMMLSLRLWTGDIFFKRGIVLLTRGYPQQAMLEMSRAVAINPNREIYWVKYGIAHEEAAKRAQDKAPLLKKAAEIHKHTMGMNPLNGYDFNNLGRVYKYWGDFVDRKKLAEAEEACQKASELDPYNVYFALDLASVYLAQKKWQKAEAIIKHLMDVFPEFALPYSYKGYIALMKNQTDVAHQFFAAATQKNWRGDINTRASTWSNLGIVRARRGELEGAITAFEEALKLKPQYLEARLNRALILEKRGLGLEAASEYRYILKKAPQYPKAEELRQKILNLERGTTQ